MTPPFPLELLPVEIQCCIIRHLDPIALISISQTNTHFRNLVGPTKTHFIERILALECLAHIGGPQIRYNRFGTLDPDRTSPEWEANRWACTSCLRLLPQHAFTNQALSRLCYRKPIPGSPVADRCTSWNPSLNRGRRGALTLQGLRVDRYSREERQLRKRYAISTTQYWGIPRRDSAPRMELLKRLTDFQDCGMLEFEGMTFPEFQSMSEIQEGQFFDADASAVEFIRAGENRHLRRCVECRFQRGEFRGCTGKARRSIGTSKVPIVVGRRMSFGTAMDRYFPDVLEVLENKRPPVKAPQFVIYRDNALDLPWTLYRVRCPGCSWWKELRAFRAGVAYPRWKPVDQTGDQYPNWDGTVVTEEFLDGMRCNHCFVHDNGREALGEVLVQWLEFFVKCHLAQVTNNLLSGLNRLYNNYTYAPSKEKSNIKALVWDLRSLFDKDSASITHADVALLRQRRAQWKEWNNLAPRWMHSDKWFMEWVNYYDESEALWFWLKAFAQEIREKGKGDVLVNWALNRDETTAS